MQYFDAHTHTNFVAFDADRNAVMLRAQEAGVAMNIVGTQYDTSASAVALAERYVDAYATIGLHPIHTAKSFHDEKELGAGGVAFTSRGEVFDPALYEKLAQSSSVIAIGECGLDYFRCDEDTKQVQKDAFVAQIELANTLKKPLMLHVRDTPGSNLAYLDVLALLKSHAKVSGDVHFFASDWEVAKPFLDLGFTLSFTGVITFTQQYNEVVKNTPLDMLLTETDAPYITPVPFRGGRNEPVHVREVVKKVAEIRGEEFDLVREQLYSNAKRVFGVL